MAYADKERLTSLAQGIRDRLLIKDKTEAQALVLSVTYPNCIYYTSDTHCIIVGGQIYGRSNQVSADAPFSYLPANVSSPAADPQFDGNHDTIYIQPIKTGTDAGKIKLWWYVNGAWTSTDTLDLVLPTEASDITYDLANTPDLGDGDVQSAIEALDGKVFGEILNKKVVAKNLRNGSPGSLTNTYAVTTYMLPTNGKQSYRFYTTRPNKENCIYHWGYIMSSDASMVGTSQTYGSVSGLVHNSDANKTRSDWSMLVLTDIVALAVGIAEYNTSTQSYSTLRIGDFEGYELGFISIDLPDRRNGLAEQPKFVDEAYEKRGWWLLPGGINTTGDLSDTSANYSQYYYEVSAGDKVMIRNSSNWSGTPSLCYAVYDKVFTKEVRPTDAVDHLMPDYSDWRTSSFHARGSIGQDYDLIIPQGGKTLVVMARIASDGTWAAYQVPHVYIQRAGQKAELKDNNYLISTWTDDEIITSTTLEIGSVVPYWSNGTRYGSRGVRLDVKEGDKVLLDTYSPALFGLIFTDENRVVKALYNDRRFDGVWTAPCDGYCYIQDVLYRDCYHYASAHGHLAYMAHNARKHVAKGGDWYNEIAPRRTQEALPIEVNKTGSAQTYIVGDDNLASWVGIDVGKFVLIATRVYTYADSAMVGTTLVTAGWHSSTATAVQVMQGGSSAYVSDGYNWGYRIYLVKVNTTSQTFYQAYWNTSSTEKNHHRIDKAYMHSFDNFADAYQLAKKIVHGEVEVDNFYGVREKEIDFVRNAIGLQSISDLGYNILDHGATLPIDEDGYKYAKEIYDRYKDNPPSGSNWNGTASPFNHDTKLVYLPQIDFSKFKTSGTDYLGLAFNGCVNLVCVGDITLPEESTGGYANFFNSTFVNCYSLKQVGNIQAPMNKNSGCYRMFYNCYALEKVGKIIVKGHQSSGLFGSCYSLERIEEIVLRDLPYDTNGNTSLLYNCVNLRYMLGKELGTRPASGTYMFNYATEYGVSNDKHPDARQSLVDSLLTYSYDRVNDPDGLGTAGTTCTITLSANSYAQLTASEIEQITAKGYTLTHP